MGSFTRITTGEVIKPNDYSPEALKSKTSSKKSTRTKIEKNVAPKKLVLNEGKTSNSKNNLENSYSSFFSKSLPGTTDYLVDRYTPRNIPLSPVAQMEQKKQEARNQEFNQYLDRLRDPAYLEQVYSYTRNSDYADLSRAANGQKGLFGRDKTYDYINNIGNARAAADLQFSVGGAQNPYAGYLEMTDDEIGIYNYLYAKNGKEDADFFLEYITKNPDYKNLNMRMAETSMERRGDSTALDILTGVPAGINQFGTGLIQSVTNKPQGTTFEQYSGQMARENLEDVGPEILGNSLGQAAYDVVQTSSNMAPAIAFSYALPLAGAPAAAAGLASSFALGASAAGNAYNQKIMEGYSPEQARLYSTLIGVSEGGLQYALGGIGALGGTSSKIASKVAGIENGIARFALKMGGSMASEGLEESLQEVIEPIISSVVFGEEYEPAKISDIVYSGLLGALSAGFMEGPGQARNALTNRGNDAVQSVSDVAGDITPVQETPLTRPVNAAEAIVQPPADVSSLVQNQEIAQPVSGPEDILVQIARESGRRSYSSYTPAERKMIAGDLFESGQVGVDAQNNVFQQTPEQHIDNRTPDAVGKKNVNAFQYDWPILQQFTKEAASQLIADADTSIQAPSNRRYERTTQGTKFINQIIDTAPIRQAMNMGLSRNDIITAAQNLIQDMGSENNAAAKRLEIVVDDMLTNGYTDIEGNYHAPNQEYIELKSNINGAKGEYGAVSEELPIWDMNTEVNRLYQPEQEKRSANESIGAADAGFDPYSNQLMWFGEIPQGEKPARQVSVQKQTAPNRRVSYTARTILESAATPDNVFNDIGQAVTDGKFSYIPITNQQARANAEKTIRTLGYQEALNKFRSDVMAGKASENVTALGAALYNAAANSNDTKLALDIAYDLASSARNGARAIQAIRILKTLTPSGRLYMLQKEINSLNEKGIGRKGSSKDNVPVDLWMQRVGENLADSLSRRINAPKETIDSVTQTILKDLRTFSRRLAPKGSRSQNTRTELQRITDLFQNYRQYSEAWDAAKDTISDTFENNPDALAAFDKWLDSSLDYTAMLTKEITGQNEIRIDEALAEKYLSAQTEQEQAEALDEIYQNIADQIPANWKEKWNAWRYMAMLTNPRTHIRNVAGNIGYQPLRMVKNQLAAGIESILDKMGVDVERTKSFSVSPDLYRAAWKDFENVSDSIGGSKYNSGASSEIQDRRKIFNIKPLESVRKGNSALLEAEDAVFKRITYAGSLSGYLKANGVSAQDFSSGNVSHDLLSRARDYASQEALKATFQDRNAFSDKVVEITRIAGPVGEALSPFKRTPANILARGFDYSPAGLLKSLSYDLAQVKSGKKTVAEAVDNVAAGLTGSALFALGAYLFSKGIIRGGEGDDKESEFDALLGHQPYSIELPGGTSITLDWLAPESLPFFMGVELANAMGEDGFTADAIGTALLSVANPMFELSMLQGVNDLIDSIKFSDGPAMLAAVPSILTSYFSQAVPTIGGQLERTAEEERMTTFTDKNSFLPSGFQYALGRASSRIPGWDFNQTPYIDAWGRTESTGGEMERFLNNFFNPAYVSQVDVDRTEKELQKIYESTGNASVFPSMAQKYITVNGDRKDLTMDQYKRYAEKKGQLSYDTVSSLLSSRYVSGMNDEEKASAIQKVYQYADAIAKNNIFGSEFPYDWMKNAKNAKKDLGISTADYIAMYEKYGSSLSGNNYDNVKEAVQNGFTVPEYMAYKENISGLTSDKDENGNTISGSKKEKVLDAIDSMDLSDSEKDWLYYLNNYSEKTIDEAPWRNR